MMITRKISSDEKIAKIGGANYYTMLSDDVGIDAGYNPSPFTEIDEGKKALLKEELKNLKDRLQIESIDLFDAIG